MKTKHGIGFDLDGTLVDSIELSATLIGDAILEITGAKFERSRIKAEFGKPEDQIIQALCSPQQSGDTFKKYLELVQRFATGFRTFPGIPECLEALKTRGWHLALYTSRARQATDIILKSQRLEAFFTFVLTGDEVPAPKPDPVGLIKICDRLAVPATEIVYVGDSSSDMEMTKQVGGHPLLVRWYGQGADARSIQGTSMLFEPNDLLRATADLFPE